MYQQNYFDPQKKERKQQSDQGMIGLQKVGEIKDINFQNHLENLKNSFIYSNIERQKLTRIIGQQAKRVIYALKSGLTLYFKDVSIDGIPMLDIYVDEMQ
jgi:hypothetical protein